MTSSASRISFRLRPIAAVVLGSAALLALPATALEVGQPAPAFTLPTASGEALSLESQRGHYVYVDFWASWCGPCKQSFPWMKTLQERHAASGFKILAINVDEQQADARRFLASTPPGFTVLFDPKGATPAAWGVQGMPSSYLVGPDGKVLLVHTSFREGEAAEFERRIAALIGSAK